MSEYYIYVGYVGSFLVAVSLTMNNIRRLRFINLFGASTFATYGVMIEAYPVIYLNSFITLIDIYYIYKMLNEKEFFAVNDTLTGKEFFLNQFFEYFKTDIKNFFPEFDINKLKNPKIILVSRKLMAASLFIYTQEDSKTALIHLDYTRPEYRDFKSAKFMYKEYIDKLKESGITQFKTYSTCKKHIQYLQKFGFKKQDDFYIKVIA